MLVLGRRTGERIIIGGPCVLTVVQVRIQGQGGPSVRLGFEGPRETVIAREEVAGRKPAPKPEVK